MYSSSQGIGDSGQGFFNGILYVLFSYKVRSYLLHVLLCCGRGSSQSTVSLSDQRAAFYGSFSSDAARRSEDRDCSDEGSDAESAGNKHQQHKSLLLNS